jgi:hypothetical protein
VGEADVLVGMLAARCQRDDVIDLIPARRDVLAADPTDAVGQFVDHERHYGLNPCGAFGGTPPDAALAIDDLPFRASSRVAFSP